MNKDLLLAASITVLLQGGFVWLGEAFSRPRIAPPKSSAATIIFKMPEMPPEDPPVDVTDEDAGAKTAAALSVPSLPDAPPMPGPITVPINPAPPSLAPDMAKIPLVFSPGPGGPGMGPIFDPSQLSRVPAALIAPPPFYPFEERRRGAEGTAVVDFIVDRRGNVVSPRALPASAGGDYPDFDAAAVAALRKWHFQPGMRGGIAVSTHMQIPIVFSLSRD